MRTSIRLALPALVAASALTLTACGGDDADDGGDSNAAAQESGGAAADESAEEETPAAPAPTVDDLRGDWYADPDAQESSTNIAFYGAEAALYFDMSVEGDGCLSGSYTDGTLAFTQCFNAAGESADDRSAELTLNEDGTLDVAWASGTTETYTNTVPDGVGFSEEDFADVEDMMSDVEEELLGG
ncbi:hypothetical protein [Streptomyces avicenniae]|uniref:hypothetical protein n=1 Tax=Streptomyces avicenniae TaxID=500153 RepID=UPI000699FFBB|nr:hypothetical protein [Streptomyces avicenniae]